MKRSYHFFIFLLMLTLLVVSVGVVNKPAAAADPVYTCFPTCSTTDGKFLTLAGTGLSTLAGDSQIMEIAVPADATSFEIGIFDGDTGGTWDIGTTPTLFTIDDDPLGDGNGNTHAVPQFSGAGLPDNDWYTLTIPTSAAAQSPSGNYFYHIHIDNSDPTAYSLNSFKLRTTGTVEMAPQAFAFIGGIFSLPDAKVIFPNYPSPTPTTYDGTWDMFVYVPDSTPSFAVWDGDLDYGAYDCSVNDTNDPDTPDTIPSWAIGTTVQPEGIASTTIACPTGTGFITGNPPDNNSVALYVRQPSVNYDILLPDGNTYHNGNPSGNQEWEQFKISDNAADVPNQADYSHIGLLPAGIYEAHLTGVDLHNLNAWRFNNYLLGVCDDGTPCAPVLHPFTIGDTVWNDLNGNGIQDDGEPGIPGVTVTLLDSNSEPITDMTATTEANGQYQFNVDAGTYSVQINSSNFDSGGALAGYVSTTGGDSQTNTVTTDNVLTYDFGYNPPATIGDFVWNDINGNGIQDSGEPGLPDVSVTLLGSDGTTVVTSTTTDASGNYSFTNLPGGTYFLQFTAPSGSVFTAMNVAGSTSDNDSNADVTTGLTDAITLTPGATDNTIDAGLKQLLSFTCPNNLVQNPSFELNTGSPPKFWTNGTAGPINVPVVDGNNAGYISGRGSMYQKINVTSGNSYSLNFFSGSHNPSIQTVKLQYFDSHNRTVGSASVHTITSDLEVSGFGGPYTLTLGAAPSNATYLEIMVSANNQDYAKVDALCLQTTTAPATAAIGDLIWNDINGNGIQETGEPGVQGVTVQLLGSDGTTVVTTTTTDASGNYSFINLPAGTYYVQFNAPSGLTFTTKNAAGSTTANDSNVNVGTGSTDAITLATGATDNTIDAGLNSCSVSPVRITWCSMRVSN